MDNVIKYALFLCYFALVLIAQRTPAWAVDTFSISGHVLNHDGQGIAGVRVVLGGTTNYALTSASGEYVLANVPAGTFNVGPYKDGYIFDPKYRSVAVGTANVTGINFTGIPAFKISGRVTDGAGAGVANVKILRLATSTVSAGGAITNANGEYVLPPAPAGTYIVQPSKDHMVFDPRYRNVTITNADVTGVNFTAAPGYTISGHIANGEGVAAPGVTVSIIVPAPPNSGQQATTFNVTTDSSGNYISPLFPPGNYYVKPSKPNSVFSPLARSVSITNADVTGVDFTIAPAYSVGGRVTDSSGTGIANVSMTISSGAPVQTNSAGYYTFLNVAAGTYTITPSLSGFVFDPASRSVTVSNANVAGVNFLGASSTSVHSISGKVATSAGVGVAGVHIKRSNSTQEVLTDANGNYTLALVPAGTYTVGAFKDGYIFDPAYRSVTVGSTNVTGVNFVAIPAYSISGHIANGAGAAVSGVKVYISKTTSTGTVGVGYVLTDTNGDYKTPPLAAATYTVIPAKENTVFDPHSRSVTVSNANVTGINFTAIPAYAIAGHIADSSGAAAPGVKVSLAPPTTGATPPPQIAEVLTDTNGNYLLPAVQAGTYIVTPRKEGAYFDPQSRTVTVGSANVTGVNFTIKPGLSIGGRIATSAGVAIANVSVTITGRPTPVLTNSAGYYAFNGLAPGTYTVTPTLSGYTFDPISATITLTNANVAKSFIGTAANPQ